MGRNGGFGGFGNGFGGSGIIIIIIILLSVLWFLATTILPVFNSVRIGQPARS